MPRSVHLFPPFSIACIRFVIGDRSIFARGIFYFDGSFQIFQEFWKKFKFSAARNTSPFFLHRDRIAIIDQFENERNCHRKEQKKKKRNKESIDMDRVDHMAWPRFCFRRFGGNSRKERRSLNVTGSEQTFAIHARYLPHDLVDYL